MRLSGILLFDWDVSGNLKMPVSTEMSTRSGPRMIGGSADWGRSMMFAAWGRGGGPRGWLRLMCRHCRSLPPPKVRGSQFFSHQFLNLILHHHFSSTCHTLTYLHNTQPVKCIILRGFKAGCWAPSIRIMNPLTICQLSLHCLCRTNISQATRKEVTMAVLLPLLLLLAAYVEQLLVWGRRNTTTKGLNSDASSREREREKKKKRKRKRERREVGGRNWWLTHWSIDRLLDI